VEFGGFDEASVDPAPNAAIDHRADTADRGIAFALQRRWSIVFKCRHVVSVSILLQVWSQSAILLTCKGKNFSPSFPISLFKPRAIWRRENCACWSFVASSSMTKERSGKLTTYGDLCGDKSAIEIVLCDTTRL
jgi:hypothetical protein